jgi:hypothetical protein
VIGCNRLEARRGIDANRASSDDAFLATARPSAGRPVRRATSTLVAMSAPDAAPAMLNAGCHAIVVKPSRPICWRRALAGSRATGWSGCGFGARGDRDAAAQEPRGTHRARPDVVSPGCGAVNATGFEFTTHRRMWFACLSCDKVWLGTRLE